MIVSATERTFTVAKGRGSFFIVTISNLIGGCCAFILREKRINNKKVKK
jgi:hypothetical protein